MSSRRPPVQPATASHTTKDDAVERTPPFRWKHGRRRTQVIVSRTATRAALEGSLRQIQEISFHVASEPSQELLRSGSMRRVDVLMVDTMVLSQLLKTDRLRFERMARAPRTILILHSEELLEASALLNLVDAWLLTDAINPERLVSILALAESGHTALPAGLDPGAKITKLRIEVFHSLSRLEQLTLLAMASRKTNAQIAAEFGLSDERTKTLVRSIFRKLRFRSRTRAGMFAARHIVRMSDKRVLS